MAFYCMVVEDAVQRSSVIFSVLKLVNHTGEEDVASDYIFDYLKEINILGKFYFFIYFFVCSMLDYNFYRPFTCVFNDTVIVLIGRCF